MQGLFRRPSGIYVLRISVPIPLRPAFCKREVIASTGTTELAIAKIVAGAEAAQWRQRFFDAGRLYMGVGISMNNDQELIRIVQGHPTLHSDGHLTVMQASVASGLSSSLLLSHAAEGRLSLFIRAANTRGYLTAILAFITAIYAYLTFRMAKASEASVEMMRDQSEAMSRPYVTMAME